MIIRKVKNPLSNLGTGTIINLLEKRLHSLWVQLFSFPWQSSIYVLQTTPVDHKSVLLNTSEQHKALSNCSPIFPFTMCNNPVANMVWD